MATPLDQQQLTDMATAIAHALQQNNAGGNASNKKTGVSAPREYSGGKDYVDFRREVQLYLKLYKSRFRNDEDKIIFILLYLKSGSASMWAENYVEVASQSGSLIIKDTWANFLAQLNTLFNDPSRHQKAFQCFNTMKQGEWEADRFLNEFDIVWTHAGLTKLEHDGIVIDRLKEALNQAVVSGVMRTDPEPRTYDAWRKQAIKVDNVEQQIRDLAAQCRGQRPAITQPARQLAFAHPYAQVSQQPVRQAAPFSQVDRRDAKGVTYGGMGQAMNVATNQVRARRACYKCGQTGHFIRDCPRGCEAIRSIIAAFKPEDRLALLEELGNAKESSFDDVDMQAVPAELGEIVDGEGFQDNQV